MESHRKQLNSILIKPAGPDCNMNCTYCFYLKKSTLFPNSKIHRMSDTILETLIQQAMTQSDQYISFGWQGGEPTLMGLPFFKKAVQYQIQYGKTQVVGNGLQTNGLILDNEWILFLKKYHFLVGLSLDGPEFIHDTYRKNINNQGSWKTVVDNVKKLLDSEVAVNVLSVVTNLAAQHPDEIYQFHRSLGLNYMQFIPCLESDPHNPHNIASFSVTPDAYGKFLCRLFDLWINDFHNGQSTTSIRLFDALFHCYVDLPPPECTLLAECGIYLTVEHNGDVYPCDFFVDPSLKLGNIQNNRLIDMLNGTDQTRFGQMKKENPVRCKDCEWLNLCQGGCPKNRIQNSQDGNLNYFCKGYQQFFKHADPILSKLAVDWKRNNNIIN